MDSHLGLSMAKDRAEPMLALQGLAYTRFANASRTRGSLSIQLQISALPTLYDHRIVLIRMLDSGLYS